MDDEELNLNMGEDSEKESSQIPLAKDGERAKKTVSSLLDYYRQLYGGGSNGSK